MHEYSIIIFITCDSLQAFDAQDGTAVSIKGNVSMPCSSIEDVQAFNGFIQRQYNFDNYTDFDTGITIINCEAQPPILHSLFDLVKEAAQVNLIDAACVLPMIAVTGGAAKKDSCKRYNLFGTFYDVITDADMAITCCPSADGTGSEELSPEHFKLLFTLDAKKIGADENELKALIAEKDALLRKNAELNARTKALELDSAELVRIKKEQAAAAAAAQKRKEEEDALYAELQEVDNRICRTDISGSIGTISHTRDTIVTKGEEICRVYSLLQTMVYIFGENNTTTGTHSIKAKRDGKLFFLKNSSEKVSNGDAVALVVDPNWTKEQAFNWYEQHKDKLPLFDKLKKKRETPEE